MYQVPDAEGGAKDVAAKGGINSKNILIYSMMYEPFNESSFVMLINHFHKSFRKMHHKMLYQTRTSSQMLRRWNECDGRG